MRQQSLPGEYPVRRGHLLMPGWPGRYPRLVGSDYLISRKWAFTTRFAITDDTGVPHFQVQAGSAFSRKLSIYDPAGAEVAIISRQGLRVRYRILARGQETTVVPRGFLGKRFEISSPTGLVEARGNISGRQYSITRGTMPVAGVTQLRTFREQFAVHVADGEDVVLMLAVVLVIEMIRDDRRRSG
jgi:uncharacterized protein YxjI